MASRLVLMPVCPSSTVSDARNFFTKAGEEAAQAVRPFEPIQAAPTPRAACLMKSRRFITTPKQPDAALAVLIMDFPRRNRLSARYLNSILSNPLLQTVVNCPGAQSGTNG